MSEYDRIPWGHAIPYTSPITGRSTMLYSIGTVAEAIGRTAQTVRRWEVGGIIPPTPFKSNGKRLYSTEHIDALVRCAEEAKIKQGSSVSQSKFTRRVYKEFKKVNALFFKEVDDESEKE